MNSILTSFLFLINWLINLHSSTSIGTVVTFAEQPHFFEILVHSPSLLDFRGFPALLHVARKLPGDLTSQFHSGMIPLRSSYFSQSAFKIEGSLRIIVFFVIKINDGSRGTE